MALSDVKLKFSLDSSGVTKTLNSTKASIKNFAASAVSSFGLVAGAAGFGALSNSAIDLGSRISDMALQLNIGTDELQVLEHAARISGVEIGILERALRNVQLRTQEAVNGNKSYSAAFHRLGIDIAEFNRLPTEKKLEKIAIAQRDAKDQTSAYNDVAIILGQRAGPKMQEVLQQLAGPGGFGGIEGAAKRAGEIMTPEVIAKLDLAADKIVAFKLRALVWTGTILGKVIPAVSILGTTISGVSHYLKTLSRGFGTALLFIGNAVKQTIQPVILQFKSLSLGLQAVAMSFKDPQKAFETFKESINLQKKSFQSLLDVPSAIAKEFEIAQREMAVMNYILEKDFKSKGDSIKKNWADIMGDRVVEAKKADNNLKGILGAGIESGGGSGRGSNSGGSENKKEFDAADKNQSGYVTPREQRAAEREQRAADQDRQNRIRDEIAAEVGAEERARQAARGLRMTAREQAAGIDTSDRIGSMTPGAGPTGEGQNKTVKAELTKQTTVLKKIETELTT